MKATANRRPGSKGGNGPMKTLLEQKERILAKIAEQERIDKVRLRKKDTRHKIIVGAGILNDVQARPELKGAITESLRRGVRLTRDIELLREEGWNI